MLGASRSCLYVFPASGKEVHGCKLSHTCVYLNCLIVLVHLAKYLHNHAQLTVPLRQVTRKFQKNCPGLQNTLRSLFCKQED